MKQPDIIVFEQVGGRVRFAHRIYREEETKSMRIETLRTNPAIVDDPGPSGLPQALEIPPEESGSKRWTNRRRIRDSCSTCALTPACRGRLGATRASRGAAGSRWSTRWRAGAPWARRWTCFDGENRERAAAAAWYAAEFIVDLVSWFGPIVKSVCVIRECVAVVEFERAPFSGAVGWATFSGTGTYTLYVHLGNVEEVVFSSRFSRAGRMSPTYMEALQKHGWHLKAPVSGMRPAR